MEGVGVNTDVFREGSGKAATVRYVAAFVGVSLLTKTTFQGINV